MGQSRNDTVCASCREGFIHVELLAKLRNFNEWVMDGSSSEQNDRYDSVIGKPDCHGRTKSGREKEERETESYQIRFVTLCLIEGYCHQHNNNYVRNVRKGK